MLVFFPPYTGAPMTYIKELSGLISTPNGNFSTSGIKIIGVGIKIKFGGNFHSISFKMPQSWLAAPPSSAGFCGYGGRFGLTMRKLSLILLFVIVPIFFAKNIIIAVFYFENNGLKQSEVWIINDRLQS